MKTITCLDCDKEFTAASAEDAMQQMRPHYMDAHQDVMQAGTEADRKAWFLRFHKDWENAPEV